MSKGHANKRNVSPGESGPETKLKQPCIRPVEDSVRDSNDQPTTDDLIWEYSISKNNKASIKHYLELSKESKLNMQRSHRPENADQGLKKPNTFRVVDESLASETETAASVRPKAAEQNNDSVAKFTPRTKSMFAKSKDLITPKFFTVEGTISAEHNNEHTKQMRSKSESYYQPDDFNDCDDGSLEELPIDDALLTLKSYPTFSFSQNNGKNSTVTETSFDQLQSFGSSLPSSPASRSGNPAFMRKSRSKVLSQPRSPAVPCMTPSLRIMTCFRIAEALRELKNKPEQSLFIMELYAIATKTGFSTGEDGQEIRFADIFFPQRPPYITGTSRQRAEQILQDISNSRPHPIDTENQLAITASSLNCRSGVLVRAMIRSSTLSFHRGPRTNIDHGPNKGSSIGSSKTSGRSQLGDMAHVFIEAMYESSWEEVEYVRGIVDPDEVEAK